MSMVGSRRAHARYPGPSGALAAPSWAYGTVNGPRSASVAGRTSGLISCHRLLRQRQSDFINFGCALSRVSPPRSGDLPRPAGDGGDDKAGQLPCRRAPRRSATLDAIRAIRPAAAETDRRGSRPATSSTRPTGRATAPARCTRPAARAAEKNLARCTLGQPRTSMTGAPSAGPASAYATLRRPASTCFSGRRRAEEAAVTVIDVHGESSWFEGRVVDRRTASAAFNTAAASAAAALSQPPPTT